MKTIYFQSIERLKAGQALALKDTVDELSSRHQALMPVITGNTDSKEVLMMAWLNMNKVCLAHTLATGRMTYWSSSRQAVWVKGEAVLATRNSSQYVLIVMAMRFYAWLDKMVPSAVPAVNIAFIWKPTRPANLLAC